MTTDLKPCRIITYNDPRGRSLLDQCEAVVDAETQVKPFLDRAISECERNNGLAVAAPQIGIPFRWFVDQDSKVFINPEITDKFDELEISEGCLSLPRKWYVCTRYKTINIKYQTLEMESKVDTLTGMDSYIFQHEVDHLDGVLISSHGKRLER